MFASVPVLKKNLFHMFYTLSFEFNNLFFYNLHSSLHNLKCVMLFLVKEIVLGRKFYECVTTLDIFRVSNTSSVVTEHRQEA